MKKCESLHRDLKKQETKIKKVNSAKKVVRTRLKVLEKKYAKEFKTLAKVVSELKSEKKKLKKLKAKVKECEKKNFTKKQPKKFKVAAKKATTKVIVKTVEVKDLNFQKAVVKKAPVKTIITKKSIGDNLKRIEGIGPKIEQLLKDAGIKTFEKLGKTFINKLKEILAAAGPRYQMHNPATWSEQSRLAAAGKWEELSTLQASLKGGRR